MENLYHYTSMTNFESIINNQSIRMTRSDFMNDPNDCKVFYSIVNKFIDNKMKDINVSHYLESVKNFIHYPSDVKTLILKYPLKNYLQFVYNNIPLYIFSLTDYKDSLPMWNYYGNNGICISFDKKSFLEKFAKNICKKEFDFLAYTKVNYIKVDENLNDLPLDSLKTIQLYKTKTDGKAEFYKACLHEYKKTKNNQVDLESFVESYVQSYIVSINYLLNDVNGNIDEFMNKNNIKSANDFYKTIFIENRKLKDIDKMKFKFDIDIFMLILSAKYKPKTFENESETRIVFFNYDIPQEINEQYATVKYDFGSFIKPYIECKFVSEEKFPLSKEIKSVILSPSTKQIPIDKDTYKKIVCKFLKKDNSFNIEISKHDIRW